MRNHQLYATVGRETYPVETWEQVSQAYVGAIEAAGCGPADVPPCNVVDARGRVVAYVAYTGRVYQGDGYESTGTLLYDPRYH